MNKFNFSSQRNRVDYIFLWKNVFERDSWNSSFFQISEIKKWVWETELLHDRYVDFSGDFFHNGKYKWPSSLYNAELVVKEAKNYTNLYDLLSSEPFNSNLNLHKSISSLCEQNSDLIEENIPSDIIFDSDFYYSNQTNEEYFKSLNFSTWPYEVFVISAICYLLENIYVTYHKDLEKFYIKTGSWLSEKNDPEFARLRKTVSFNIRILICKVEEYLLDEKYSKKLFSVLTNTNIFRIESVATINAFTYIFDKLRKKYFEHCFDINSNIIETLFRFFQVFKLDFIFCDFFY